MPRSAGDDRADVDRPVGIPDDGDMNITRLLQHAASVSFLMLLCSCLGPGGPVYQKAEGAIGPYSGAVLAGDFCFVAGKIGDRSGSFEQEVVSVLDAVEEELGRAGLQLSDVVAATVYLTDMERYGDFNKLYGARFQDPYPARVCVAVAALPAGARVEVQVTARR